MSRSAHFVKVLRAIIDDPRANENERRCAQVALEVHLGKTAPSPVPDDVVTTVVPRGMPGTVLTIEGSTWTLIHNGATLGTWSGEATFIRQEPVERFGPVRGYRIHPSSSDIWDVRAVVYANRDAELYRVLHRGLDIHLVAYPEGQRYVFVSEARIADIRHGTDPNHYNTRFTTYIDMAAVVRRSMLQVNLALGAGQ